MQENEKKPTLESVWADYRDENSLKRLFKVVLWVVFVVALVAALPLVFNSLANLIRSYKNFQHALRE